jgi:hypothetical protein
VGFVVDKVALAQIFSEYFRFPCQSSFHQTIHNHSHLSSGAGTIGQLVAAVPSRLSFTPLRRNNLSPLPIVSISSFSSLFIIFYVFCLSIFPFPAELLV